MGASQCTFRLSAIPDPAYPCYQLRAGGDVGTATGEDTLHLVRTLASFPTGSVSVAIRYLYQPEANGRDPQDRLEVFLSGQAHSEDSAASLSLLMEEGPLNRFYELKPCRKLPVHWSKFSAACDVVRRQTIREPTVTSEFNAKALPAYYTIHSFEPNQENDYLRLDGVLGGLKEPALIDICVEPTDTRRQLSEHTRYLSQLMQVNRSWDDDDDDFLAEDWANYGGNTRSEARNLRLLRNREPMADDVLREAQRFHETLSLPHLSFHIRVFAQTIGVARLLASVVAESAFQNGSYQLFGFSRDDPLFGKITRERKNLCVIGFPALGELLGGQEIGLFDGLSELASMSTADELAGVFRLPLASYGSPCCIRKNTDPPVQNADDLIVLGYDEQSMVGAADKARALPRGIHRKDLLAKHAFFGGVPGSGKTTSLEHVLQQLHLRGIPFVVFEPVKREYRRLKCLKGRRNRGIRRLAQDLRIYTPGNERISPFRFNPLRLLPGISRDEHIETLITCFKAAMPMFAAFPAILGEALEQIYEEHPDLSKPPIMSDLLVAAENVLGGKNYSGEINSDLRAAIEVRLGLLTRRAIGHIFQGGPDSPSVHRLLTSPTIIELASLPVEQACLLTLFILTAVREAVGTTPSDEGEVRFVVVLEEAHNIVGVSREAVQSEEQADPKAFAAEFVCLMLAELRALGIGIIIADQLPSTVAPQVIKNTASKLAFRQVANKDREELGGTMLFGPIEMEEIARLRPGEAYFYTEGYFGPRRIRTPDINARLDIPPPPMGEAIVPYLCDDPWFIEAREGRVFAMLEKLMGAMDDFDATRKEVINLSRELSKELEIAAGLSTVKERSTRRARLGQSAQVLWKRLDSAFNVFVNDVYRPILGSVSEKEISSETLRAYYEQIVTRFESKIRPDVVRGLNFFDRKISLCKEDSN